ncbi:MAG: hypothetical protein IPK91_13620 [Saprospiraceae bacterium]|nr:hypothetical protein [Saprospiraceae bacterium]MBK8298285.1 hypothetical protein [Saprospiraceae bacterium]
MRSFKTSNFLLIITFFNFLTYCSAQINRVALEVLCKESILIVSGSVLVITCNTNEPGIFECTYDFVIDSVYKGKPRLNFESTSFREITITRTVPCIGNDFYRISKPKAIGCWEEYNKEDKLVLFLNDNKRRAYSNKILLYEATDEFIFSIKKTNHLEIIIKSLVNK